MRFSATGVGSLSPSPQPIRPIPAALSLSWPAGLYAPYDTHPIYCFKRWRVRISCGVPAWMKLITTFPLKHYDQVSINRLEFSKPRWATKLHYAVGADGGSTGCVVDAPDCKALRLQIVAAAAPRKRRRVTFLGHGQALSRLVPASAIADQHGHGRRHGPSCRSRRGIRSPPRC